MKKLLTAALLLAGCSSPAREPLPDGAGTYGPPRAAAPPAAPPDAVGPVTLDRALALAESLHPDLAESRARIEAAEGRAEQSGLLPNPVLLGKLESAPFEGDTVGDAELLAGVLQRVPIGGRLGAAEEAGRLEAERLRREHEVQRIHLRTRVHGAFATALFSAAVAKLQEETLELARRGAAVARARREAGDATAEELARAELEEARARLEEDKAHGLRELAYVALAAAMGRPELRVEAVEGPLESALELPALQSVLEALEHGPHAALARADVDAARAAVDHAGAERIPDVAVDLVYRRIGSRDENAFDVGLAIPLPLFDRNQGRIREAEAQRREAEARARATRGEAIRHVRESHTKLAEAMSHVKLAREEILPRSELILRAAEARHAAGDLSLADLIPLRREAAGARLAYLDGLRELMEAWGELRLFLKP
jgi:cobalt-zinc-cadmium efflux system outer membrane protein